MPTSTTDIAFKAPDARRLHVAIVSEYARPWPGGISEHVFYEARELVAGGHEVTLITGPDAHAQAGVRIISLSRAIEFRGNGARSRLSIGRSVVTLRRTFRALCVDVVHVHAPLEPLLPLAAVLASPVPVVGTFHASHGDSLAWRALYRGPWGRLAFARLAHRICVSHEAERTVRTFFPDATLTCIPNGVDASAFRVGGNIEQPSVLFVGRPDPRKGLGDALTAFQAVKRSLPRARFRLVGVDERDLSQFRTSLHHGVEALGYVAPEAIVDEYRKAHLLCAPSLGGESQGIVLLEAMASGVVPVGYRIPGYQETLETVDDVSTCGVLVPLRDTDALGSAMIRLLVNEGERAGIAAHARIHALSFDWKSVGSRIEEVLVRAARTDSVLS